jgi:hypothetical protein
MVLGAVFGKDLDAVNLLTRQDGRGDATVVALQAELQAAWGVHDAVDGHDGTGVREPDSLA